MNNGRRKTLAGVIAAACVAIAAALGLRGRTTADGLRARVVEIAGSQLGQANLNEYFRAVAPQFIGGNPSWCGIFALWALQQAGLTDWRWETGRGFLYRLPQTRDPKPGDIAYYDANQHQAVVVRRRGDIVDVLNGNGVGGVVTASSPAFAKARAYYSIEPLITARLGGSR